jgi:hypothetical protein
MQRTASQPAIYLLCVCHPPFRCVARFTGLAVADLVRRTAPMKFVAPSTLTEYARQFWRRERDKGNAQGIQNLKAVERGVDPVRLLQEAHSYKLPRQNNGHVSVVAFINRGEVESLLVHDYMPNDKWMQERGLVPQPFTRQLGILAEIC